MTDTSFGRAGRRQDGDLALCVFLEPLLDRRRVLVLGSLDNDTRKRLARLVDDAEFFDEGDLHGELDLPCSDGAFDAIWLVDSSLLRPTATTLAELKRVLARDGALIISSTVDPEPKHRPVGPPEAGLSRALWPEFLDLRLYRQAPVVGQGLEEIGVSGARVVVDQTLVAHAEPVPERIVAVASDVQLRLDSALWIQSAAPSVTTGHAEEQLRQRLQEATDRAHTLSLTLDAAEADLENAFSRAQALDAQIREKDAATAHERERRIRAERSLEQAKAAAARHEQEAATAEAARGAAQVELERVSSEFSELEGRLAERGAHVQALEDDNKRSHAVARDLIEEVRRLEQECTGAEERRTLIAELEAEVTSAVNRAIEAEVARESSKMRVDELLARIRQLEALPARTASVDSTLEGTLFGLRLRIRELEHALEESDARAKSYAESADTVRGQVTGLALRLAETERALVHAGEANTSASSMASDYEERLRELERELEEADRFAEAHADDGDRIESLENELTRTQCRNDDIEDDLRTTQEELRTAQDRLRTAQEELRASQEELRAAREDLSATQDELQTARSEVEHVAVETAARLELAQRRENEARLERDHARTALEEARTILAQLNGKVPMDFSDPSVS